MKLMLSLNCEQREFVMHVLNCFKNMLLPIRIFLSGSAGVGKSMIIRCLYQLITNYFDNLPGATKDKLVVLLCAPSGKTAFLINGVTLHTAFALPVSQFGGQMPELSADLANKIREKLFDLKLLIIDEVSMVGSTLLSRVDTRLRQIMGKNQEFGGVSVILVGDLNQLPPVMDSPIYKCNKSNEFNGFLGINPLWEIFSFYELTQIMRQKDEKQFIMALNNLAIGQMSKDDINLIESRQVSEPEIPIGAIRLFSENKNVDIFNTNKINNHPGEEYSAEAKDIILGKVTDATKTRVLDSLKNKKNSEVNGLPYIIQLKLGIKYMITNNIDVEDGLVNGACEILKHISFDSNSIPTKLWLDFQPKSIGNKARLPFLEYMKSNKIDKNLIPLSKSAIPLTITNKLQHQTIRKQFSIVPAEALTIHKSQGQTYQEVCVDFNISKRFTRQMLYVALSRVTKLSGLYIIGKFKASKLAKDDDPIVMELNRLRLERNLKLTFNNLKDVNKPIIIYQNINSLSSKFKHILKDKWYQRGQNILIFSETLTKSCDKFQIPHHKKVFRSDIKDCSRGIICFASDELYITNIEHILDINKSNDKTKSHVELFSFKIDNFCIISGYKSPSTPNKLFEISFEKIMAKIQNLSDEIVVLGDFNFDLRNNEKSFLIKYLEKYNFNSLLPNDMTSTDLNTQIDVIFGTSKNVSAGIYETYFSYHKPIFAILNKTNIHFDNEQRHKINFEILEISTDNVENGTLENFNSQITVSSGHLLQNTTKNDDNNSNPTNLQLLDRNSMLSWVKNILTEIYNIDKNLPVFDYKIILQNIFHRYEDFLEILKTDICQIESAILNSQIIDVQRNTKIYNAISERAAVIKTRGDGSWFV